jgi:SAM-dependent methyltransferase
MDADALQFPEALFDAVLCAFGLMEVSDPLRVLQEMHRVLRPAGRVVVAVWRPHLHRGGAAMVPLLAARGRMDRWPLSSRLGTGDVLTQLVQTAGYTAVMCERLRTVRYYPSAEEAYTVMGGRPEAVAEVAGNGRTCQVAQGTARTALMPSCQGQGYAISGEVVIVSGCKR